MSKVSFNSLCGACSTVSEINRSSAKKNIFGFYTQTCPKCGKQMLAPLSLSYFSLYWIILGFNILFLVKAISNSGISDLNPVGMAFLVFVSYSLVKNEKLKIDIKRSLKNA